MKHVLLYITISLFGLGGLAQAEFTRADRADFENADFFFYQERYVEAYPILEELYKSYPNKMEIAYRFGVCEIEVTKNYKKAEELLNFSLSMGEHESMFYLAKIKHLKHEFSAAINQYKEYNLAGTKEKTEEQVYKEINACKQAKTLTQNPEDVLVVNMGETINSPYAEYIPVITSNEDELYFTSRRDNSTGGKTDPNEKFFEDVYYSKKVDGVWKKPTNDLEKINTDTHDATAAISSDGSSMVIYRTNKQLTGGDLYITNKIGDKWSEPALLDENINTNFQEASACFSPDGNTLYFSSNRPGGFGGKDLYRVKLLPNGEWSLPKNLGAAINTSSDEDSPFMDVDGRTLYFASKGHNSMGGYDIFTSKRRGIEAWTEPENLGFPANSVGDDIYLSITPGGRKGYYSSEKENGFGDQDLYEINFIYRQQTNLIIKGELLDTEGNPVKGEITVIDERSKKLQGLYTSNSNSGKYLLILNPLVNYKVIVQAEGRESVMTEYYFEFPNDDNAEIEVEPIILN